jgi:ABC-type dipeptide/oligopeptide/nickel transport system permease component
MLQYVVRRALLTIPIVLAVIAITFTLGFYAPGDPIRLIFGQDHPVNEEIVQRLRHQYGLDRPYPVQLGDYMLKLTHGDFGTSISLKRPVGQTIVYALPISAQLAAGAIVLLIVLGIPLGILAALKQNSVFDYVILFGAVTFASIPSFVLAPLLMILLILDLHLIPSTTGWDGLFSVKAILPVSTLALTSILGVIRFTRASVLEVLSQDYIRTARAKGLPVRLVILRHILKNSMTPVLTALGLTVSGLITGSIFLENIFGISGFGSLVVNGLTGYDYPVILATTIVGTLIVITSNLIVDILYGGLDPRVRVRYD